MVQKIVVTLNPATVADLDRWVRQGPYPNRSRALQSAMDLLAEREKRTRLARELKKLDRAEEIRLAEEGLGMNPGQHINWADLDPVRGREQAGKRPVVILSNSLFNRHSGTVIAMAITSQPQRAGFPLTLELPEDCLPQASWVKISQVRTISIERVGKRIGEVDAIELNRIVDGLTELIS